MTAPVDIRRKPVKPILHVGLVPLLWTITTCKCGQRWPCNDIKLYLRRRFGWTTDITGHLKTLTDDLPKPATRWSGLRRLFSRWTATADRSSSACGVPHSFCDDAE